ncbi:putative traf-type zinc finger family protein [Klebsormidium nitens]|uniref:Putative traf-type zinc finger family protein n=1 Tax=Klebsormidium nitens TaxID=105231 RepID=A0A1Y1HQ93_KLENI|nr:putative traf-type zinc finger family protein [Klebsormidium nitens]|eukprot:GAQ79369.1 putative traf-type zinc finger family protein [Klebsormidium nitens]
MDGCFEGQAGQGGCIVAPTLGFAAHRGGSLEALQASASHSAVRSFAQPAQTSAAWTMFPAQQQYELSLPRHLVEQAKRHQDQGTTASNQPSLVAPSRLFSDTAPTLQFPCDSFAQRLFNGAQPTTMDSTPAPPSTAPVPVPTPSQQMLWHSCGGRKRPRAMIEAPHLPWRTAPSQLLGSQEVPQVRLAIPLSHPSSPVINASPSETFRLPSRSASPTPAQSQQTEEVNCGREERGPCERVCLPRPALATPAQPVLLPGSKLLSPPVLCDLCGQRRPIGLMGAHLKLECPFTPAQCPHKGCSWQGPRQLLKLHVDEICKWVLVPCPFTAPGWPPTIPRGLVRNWQFQPAGGRVQTAAGKCPAGIASPCPVIPEKGRRHVSINESSELDEEDSELQSDADSAWSRTRAPARPLLAGVPRMF